METAELNLLDELYLHLDRDDEPWSVHLEIRVEGRVEDERLRTATREAALLHPLARARLRDPRGTDVRYHWEIADELDDVPLTIRECRDEEELDALREELLGHTPALDRPGPFSLLLAHMPDGDALVLNLHHAAGDGLAALRLMGSIARAYGGEDDPLPEVDPLEVRDIRALAGSQSLADRLKRSRSALEYLTRGMAPPVRIAPEGAEELPGYGFERLMLGPDELERVIAHRRDGATANDVLLGALAVTVREWNERRGAGTGPAYLMMPINLRPPEWRFELVGNYASYVSVHVEEEAQGDLAQAVEAAAAATTRIKDAGVAGLIVDLFELPTMLPTAVKQRLQDLIPLTGNVVVDTAVLSNLGRIEAVPRLAEAGAVREVWFSPPGRMPLGASLGVATLDERLFVTLRYRHAQFDRAAAAEFLALLHAVVVA